MSTCFQCINYGKPNSEACAGCNPIYKNFHSSIGKPKTALDSQEGGQHYKDKAIQPIVYIHANKLGFCEGNVVKYITRHKEKNGAEDIRKVIHYCELLLELEYKDE